MEGVHHSISIDLPQARVYDQKKQVVTQKEWRQKIINVPANVLMGESSFQGELRKEVCVTEKNGESANEGV